MESLRAQYEDQVQSLRQELEEERKAQGHLRSTTLPHSGDAQPPPEDGAGKGSKVRRKASVKPPTAYDLSMISGERGGLTTDFPERNGSINPCREAFGHGYNPKL